MNIPPALRDLARTVGKSSVSGNLLSLLTKLCDRDGHSIAIDHARGGPWIIRVGGREMGNHPDLGRALMLVVTSYDYKKQGKETPHGG